MDSNLLELRSKIHYLVAFDQSGQRNFFGTSVLIGRSNAILH